MTASTSVRVSTAVADPDIPGNVIRPNSDGSINVRYTGMIVTQQSGTAYTLQLSDAETYIQFTNGSAVAATIPTNATVAFPIGTTITLEQDGAGTVTATAAGGVTLHTPTSGAASAAQYAEVYLTKVATNTWISNRNPAS